MVAETLAPTRPLRTLRIGVILALGITLIDVIGMLVMGLPNAPLEVNIITSTLAIATVIGGIGAWRGAGWGVWLVAISRLLSALSVVPILLVPEAPGEALPVAIVVLALSVVTIVVLFVGFAGRRRVR